MKDCRKISKVGDTDITFKAVVVIALVFDLVIVIKKGSH